MLRAFSLVTTLKAMGLFDGMLRAGGGPEKIKTKTCNVAGAGKITVGNIFCTCEALSVLPPFAVLIHVNKKPQGADGDLDPRQPSGNYSQLMTAWYAFGVSGAT